MLIVQVTVVLYVVASLVIGALVGRRIRTEEDYIVAGRRLSFPLVTFTVFATWFGAETCLGAAGAIYQQGLGAGSADPFGYAACIFLVGLVFAVPLWRRKLVTLADLFRQRFGPQVERLAVLLMVPSSLLWAAAQIRAFGQVISAGTGFDSDATITAAAAVVIVYTLFGGLLADVWTDLIQGIALIVGLVMLMGSVLLRHGSAPFAAIEPERLRLFDVAGQGLLSTLERWSIPVVGSVVAAELVGRVIAARTPQIAQRATIAAAGLYLGVGLIPVALGLAGASLMPGLADPEQLLPQLAGEYLPTLAYALFLGAIVSAILSTVDSTLLVSASLVSHNVVLPLRPDLSERAKLRLARGGVLCFGIVAYSLAFSAEGVYALVQEASAFASAGIVVVVVLGLFTRVGGAASAAGALVLGGVVWVVGAYLLGWSYPYLASLAAALAGYFALVGVGDEPELERVSAHGRRTAA
ncbi:MAG TPA: sodium:solute symporter family protein [Thermoanaerobaculia bacterium]|nr:sodium:solute symporter family protein [Thermoanaerobaculia bacterium]